MDINFLVKVTSRAWSLNILALMYGGVPGRQASLLLASGAGRTAFTQSLGHLVDLQLVERNPGYGHPLRPEYRLTEKGADVAVFAERIKRITPDTSSHILLRRAWTIPVLAVSQRPRYFIDFKRELVSITDRSLSQSLKLLQTHHWINREIDSDSYPPRPVYQAVNEGAQICQAINLGAL